MTLSDAIILAGGLALISLVWAAAGAWIIEPEEYDEPLLGIGAADHVPEDDE
jgi:hypothetical protein